MDLRSGYALPPSQPLCGQKHLKPGRTTLIETRKLFRRPEPPLSARKHDFSLERAAFLTVLHRLFCGGSDRAAGRWREDYRIDGAEGLELHHLYRAMAWLGEELPEDQQDAAMSIGAEK